MHTIAYMLEDTYTLGVDYYSLRECAALSLNISIGLALYTSRLRLCG